MKDDRVKVYGEDAEKRKRRALDCIVIDGRLFLETVDRSGHKIRTPARVVMNALEQARQYMEQVS